MESSPPSFWSRCQDALKGVPCILGAWRWLKRAFRKLHWLPRILAGVLRGFVRHDVVFYDGYGVFRHWHLVPSNWGDDFNFHFFGFVTGKKMWPVPPSAHLIPVRRHILIGSVLNWSPLDGAVVYGSGLIDGDAPVQGVPRRICSVRGPLTREALLRRGVACPAKYGDPALLLPLFYSPPRNPTGPVAVIPHVDTPASPVLEALEKHGCRRIDMRAPGRWTDIPDQIAASSLVLSESLHGLVVAEAYGIPCAWVEFVPHSTGDLPRPTTRDWTFKYRDFYASVGKTGMAPLQLYAMEGLPDLDALRSAWKPARIDFRELLSCFPFPLAVRPRFPDGAGIISGNRKGETP